MAEQGKGFTLPNGVVGRVDVGRLLREAKNLDEFFTQAAIREPGQNVKMPKTSRMMDELLHVNNINVLVEAERVRLQEALQIVKEQAPLLHMSFNADPSPLFTTRLIDWLRREIHPFVLLQVGLQPSIGAGSILRTTNKAFDFSLKHRFAERRQILVSRLVGFETPAAENLPAPAQPAAQPATAQPVAAVQPAATVQPVAKEVAAK